MGGPRENRLHTMTPGVSDMLKRMGMDEMYKKLKQLDEAAVLVDEGKLKREVYDQLVINVEKEITDLQNGQKNGAKKDDKHRGGLLDKLFENLRPAREHIEEKGRGASLAPEEKPLYSGTLYVKVGASLLNKSPWKKRWCVLFPRTFMVFKRKEEKVAQDTIILTPEFFVSQLDGGGDMVGPTSPKQNVARDDDEESVVSSKHAGAGGDGGRFTFILSDLETKMTLSASTDEERIMWVHLLMATIRKILEEESYFDTPRFIDGPVREPVKIQEDFEARKKAYLQSQRKKTLELNSKSGKGFFSKAKKMTEEDWAKEEAKWEQEGEGAALSEVARRLIEQEREHVRQLEEEQQRREEELASAKQSAEQWKRVAEDKSQQLAAQEQLIQQLRMNNIEKEEAIRAEQATAAAQLDALHSKRRQSQHPAALADYEKQIKALEAKLAALQDALHVDLDGLDWDGTLEDAEKKMKLVLPRLMSENEAEQMKAQDEFDQWDKIIRNHADYKKREDDKWKNWEIEQKPKNEAALKEMRKIVPKEVITGISEQFLRDRGLTAAAAKRVMGTKILQFLWYDQDFIAKVHIADLNSRYVPQGLDIVELRAVYCCMPQEFQLDRDGSKKSWLESLRSKLFELTEKEKQGKLSRAEARNNVYRGANDQASDPLPKPAAGGGKPAAKGGAKGGAKKKGGPAVTKKLDTSKLEGLFAGGGPASKAPPAGGLPGMPAPGGPPPHVLAMLQRSQAAAAGEPAKPAAQAAAAPAPAEEKRKSKVRSIRMAGSALVSSMKNMLGVPQEQAPPEAPKAPSAPAEVVASSTQPAKSKGRGKKSMTEKQKLLADGVRAQMDTFKNDYGTDLDGFDEGSAPAFDFGTDYGSRKVTLSRARAGEFSKGIEEGIEELVRVIAQNGKPDKSEGGYKTISFGELFQLYEKISDLLVGLLMRAKKRKLLKYSGDILFQGIHDSVKITLLNPPTK